MLEPGDLGEMGRKRTPQKLDRIHNDGNMIMWAYY